MSLVDIQAVVVPVDFSEESRAAIDRAMELVDGDATRVHVIHVLAQMSPADPGVYWGEISDDNRARHVEEAMVEQGLHKEISSMHRKVIFGDAGFRIARYAQDIDADLVVIPSHGRTGLKRLLIGSVAERVIRYAHCPVLVLRSHRKQG
jgi:nucleotide-binding universal stress UspA family protein